MARARAATLIHAMPSAATTGTPGFGLRLSGRGIPRAAARWRRLLHRLHRCALREQGRPQSRQIFISTIPGLGIASAQAQADQLNAAGGVGGDLLGAEPQKSVTKDGGHISLLLVLVPGVPAPAGRPCSSVNLADQASPAEVRAPAARRSKHVLALGGGQVLAVQPERGGEGRLPRTLPERRCASACPVPAQPPLRASWRGPR
jgi:hypothetical protein